MGLLEKGMAAIKQTLASLLHPPQHPGNYDEAVVAAWARTDQKKDHARLLQREAEEAEARAKELEEQAREARSDLALHLQSVMCLIMPSSR